MARLKLVPRPRIQEYKAARGNSVTEGLGVSYISSNICACHPTGTGNTPLLDMVCNVFEQNSRRSLLMVALFVLNAIRTA